MFTGIISDIGRVAAITRAGDMHACLETGYPAGEIAIGASIAFDGVCLTVTDRGAAGEGAWVEVDVSAETLARTTLGNWREGGRVNLERALRVGDELGGHIVSGHVDGTADVIEVRREGESLRISLRAPRDLARFIAPKGSVALNGTSLTVNEVAGGRFGVNLIPHTLEVTTWGDVAAGDRANLEIDTLARYVARLAEAG